MAKIVITHFLIGLCIGGALEFVYRSMKQKKLVAPAFANAQMYAFAAVLLYLLSLTGFGWAWKILLIFFIPTVLEFITGYVYFRLTGRRLWDYSDKPLNFAGIICFEFSLYWFVLSSVYYLVVLK